MYKARTPEAYREYMNEVAKTKVGRWRLMTREILYSLAFTALDKGGIIAVLAVMDKLKFEKKGKDQKGVKTDRLTLRDGGQFTLSINELIALGISKSSAIRGRNQAWELGFFDVIESGTIHHAGTYRYSTRWMLYPDGDYKPTGQQPPGKNVYPDNSFKTRPRQSDVVDGDESIFSSTAFDQSCLQ
jgi:hypothetical protein